MVGKRILIRAPKTPDLAVSAEASLAYGSNGVFGSNAGNMLFADSVFRTISVPGTELVPDSYTTERLGSDATHAARINDEFDMFVVPLANAFRDEFRAPLQRLTKVVQNLTIPVVVTGIGAQLPPSGALDGVSDDLRTDVKAFVSAVLSRSASIGVRGELTARFLRELGFGDDVVDVIGCPSMLDFRGDPPVVRRRVDDLGPDSPIALNLNTKAPWAAELLGHHLREYDDCVYVGQEHHELALLLWGQPVPGARPGMPATRDDPWIRQDRVRFFVDTRTWHEFMRARHFAFGHRIHGSVAAIAAGTPACVLTFDSRTAELADYHGIPQVPCETMSPDTLDALDARTLHDSIDLTELNERRGPTRDTFLAFLDRNEVEHVPAGQQAEEDAPGDLPPAVGPDFSAEALGGRVRWLWNETRRTNPERYVPPFSPVPHRTVDARVTALEARCARLDGALRQLVEDHKTLRAELAARRAASAPTVGSLD